MEVLTKEDVMHVAHLARLALAEEEIGVYQKQLSDILTDIQKINEVDIDEAKEIMISPVMHKTVCASDEASTSLTMEEIFRNVPKRQGDYVIVPEVMDGD